MSDVLDPAPGAELSDRPRPILFLGVDGVLNCFCADSEQVTGTIPWLPADSRRREEHLNRYGSDDPSEYDGLTKERSADIPHGMRERLARVLPLYEPVWATFWFTDAHPVLAAHLGLPEQPWPYLAFDGHWKLPAIIQYAAGRPWAWVDDDATFEQRNNPEAIIPGDALIIEPRPSSGLTDEHVDELIGFATRNAAR